MPSDRVIGLFFAAIFSVVWLWPLLDVPRSFNWWALGVSCAFLLMAFLWPTALRPLNHIWMGVGRVFQLVFPPVFLTAFYWLFFTPIAVVTRVLSRPELDLRWKAKKAETWWVERRVAGPPPQSISKQY